MLQAQLFYPVEKNKFTKPAELGRRSCVTIIWWAQPQPLVDIRLGDLVVELTPDNCKDFTRNITEASAKAQAWPNTCADQGLQVDTQALAELGPIGASIEAAETEHSEKLRKFAEQIARLHIAGEVRDLGDGTYSEYSPDGCSDDDAQTLYRLIEDARELTGAKPDCLVDKRTLNHCDGCGEWFPLDKPECPVCGQEVQ